MTSATAPEPTICFIMTSVIASMCLQDRMVLTPLKYNHYYDYNENELQIMLNCLSIWSRWLIQIQI